MERTIRFSLTGKGGMRSQKLVDAFVKAWQQVWKQIPHEERVSFLKSLAEENLSAFLSDMNREERASLMNTLLPLIAQEFPLADLDLLTAFSSPKDLYAESQNESE